MSVPSFAMPADREAKIEHIRNLSSILMAGIVMMSLAWVGYIGSDDHSYTRGALGWLAYFPYVGGDHWTLRHTVVIPIALSLGVFGLHELSLGLPSALFFLLFLGINYHYLRRFLGTGIAFPTSVLMATTPLFVIQATFPQDTIVTTLAVSLSFWLFCCAARRNKPNWWMFGAGVAAAFGWLTLEIAAGLLVFYGILFLTGFGVSRRYYGVMALGFVLLVGMEVIYFTVLTGDPLYRYRIDLFHDVIDRIGDAKAAMTSGMMLNLEGNLAVNVFLDPFVALLINQEFGFLFWAYVPAAIWAWRTQSVSMEDQRLLKLLIGLGTVWMGLVSLNGSVLYVVPRYYGAFSWAAIIVVVYWLRWLLYANCAKLAIIVGSGLLTTNLLCIYLENKNPLFAERALVEYVTHNRGIVYTDPMTATRARLLLEFRGVSHRVLGAPVPQGGLFYANLKNIERCKRNAARCKWSWEHYMPKDGWIEKTRIQPRRKLSGILLSWLGFHRIIPKEIFDRLDSPNTPGIVYLVATGNPQHASGRTF